MKRQIRSTIHSPLFQCFSAALPVFLILFLLAASAPGQRRVVIQGAGQKIDGKAKSGIIDAVTNALNEVYVFPEKAREMELLVRKKLKVAPDRDLRQS